MIHLRGAGTDLVVDVDIGAPVVVHWGTPLGPDIDVTGLASLASALDRPLVQGSPDVVAERRTPVHDNRSTRVDVDDEVGATPA